MILSFWLYRGLLVFFFVGFGHKKSQFHHSNSLKISHGLHRHQLFSFLLNISPLHLCSLNGQLQASIAWTQRTAMQKQRRKRKKKHDPQNEQHRMENATIMLVCALNFDKAPRQRNCNSVSSCACHRHLGSGITFITFNERMSFQKQYALANVHFDFIY